MRASARLGSSPASTTTRLPRRLRAPMWSCSTTPDTPTDSSARCSTDSAGRSRRPMATGRWRRWWTSRACKALPFGPSCRRCRRMRCERFVRSCGARHGHPVLWRRDVLALLAAADPAQGARAIMRALAAQGAVCDVPVDDEGVFSDLDTPEDYASADPGGRTVGRATAYGLRLTGSTQRAYRDSGLGDSGYRCSFDGRRHRSK